LLLLVSLAACSQTAKVPATAEPAIVAAPAMVNRVEPAPAPAPPDTPVASPPAVAAAPAPAPGPFARSADCQIHGRGDWSAYVDAMRGPGARPRLIVTGTVASKPAARIELRLDPAVMESNPPQRIVNLTVRLPREPTIDMLTRREVRGEWPVTLPLGAVHIRCGGRSVASITDIVVAQ
jgi:hypothetical protein